MNESTLVPREELSDLDWLARNVHKWPAGEHQPWCYVYMTYGGVMKAAGNFLDAVANPTMITIEQWLAHRAELQNKPSWKDAPEWAIELAQDSDGKWFFYADTPTAGQVSWRVEGTGDNELSGKGEILGDWRDTLEKRPETCLKSMSGVHSDGDMIALHEELKDFDMNKFEPFTSIEDNQGQKMKQDNGWFERGDLPPVGIAVQLWHGGTYAYDCELIAKRGNDFVLWNLTWDRPDSADCMMCIFKPTPTEREVLADLIESHGQMSALVIADAILAAGFSLGAK